MVYVTSERDAAWRHLNAFPLAALVASPSASSEFSIDGVDRSRGYKVRVCRGPPDLARCSATVRIYSTCPIHRILIKLLK
jgi:hypothetical protein